MFSQATPNPTKNYPYKTSRRNGYPSRLFFLNTINNTDSIESVLMVVFIKL